MELPRAPHGFKHLRVYQHALETSRQTHLRTKGVQWGCHIYLRDQLYRATSSVAANIAEGYGRESVNDSVRFWMIAKASAAECAHHLSELNLLGILSDKECAELAARHESAERMLRKLIQGRKKSSRY